MVNAFSPNPIDRPLIYNPWPNGKLPTELQRPELGQIKEMGYEFEDPREVIAIFENKVAEFAGAKYAVVVDCCTHAMELALRYQISKAEITTRTSIFIPDNTYVSVYWMLKQLGFSVRMDERQWSGIYNLEGSRVWDSAVRWKKGMYQLSTFQCLSFQIKKTIPIGRGGMIFTDDKEAADWLRLASYDGRDLTIPYDHLGHVKTNGWHYYMTPEDAARGILLMNAITKQGDSAGSENYPSISKMLGI